MWSLRVAGVKLEDANSLMGLARETGLEPAASAVTGRRSNQLSYSRNPKSDGRRSARRHTVEIRDACPGVKPEFCGFVRNPAARWG